MRQKAGAIEKLIPNGMQPGNVYRLRLDSVPEDAPGPWCVAVTDRHLLRDGGETVFFGSPDDALAAFAEIEEIYKEVMRRDGNA